MVGVDGNKMSFLLLINFSFFDEAEIEFIAAPQTGAQVKLVTAGPDDVAGEVMVETEEAIVVDDKVAETEEAIVVRDDKVADED